MARAGPGYITGSHLLPFLGVFKPFFFLLLFRSMGLLPLVLAVN